MKATARVHPNIALVKYWGKRDVALNLPAVPSLSLTLERFATRTTVEWGVEQDEVVLNGKLADPRAAQKVLAFLDLLLANRPPCRVDSENNFPTGAGLASSSSGFAALALAGAAACEHPMPMNELSALARMGSGSACRSLWGGFVEWKLGTRPDGLDSHGVQIADEEWWPVRMVVCVVSGNKKPVGSTDGMERARRTSPLYATWLAGAAEDVDRARDAVLRRDLEALGTVMEASTYKMHATMHTSKPPLHYWLPGTMAVLHEVGNLRRNGIGAWATMDAGPNVKVLCALQDCMRIEKALKPLVDAIEVVGPGPAPRVKVHG